MSIYLTDAEIAGMKETADLALPDTGTIRRATFASDGMGGFTETWATSATVACRVDFPGSIRLDQWQEKIQNRSVFILNVPADTELLGDDQVTVGTVIYSVIGVLSGSWEITERAVVVKVS
jgi:hypothetical protein